MAISLAKIRESKAVKATLLVSSICGALAAIYKFGDVYDHLNLPRPVFVHEYNSTIEEIRDRLRAFEIDYRQRAIMYDQKLLREVERDIDAIRARNGQVPDSMLELHDRLEESLRNHRERLAALNVR